MNILKKLRQSNFVIRLTSWEYWPFGIIQFPFFIYWLWLSLRARSLVFFSASNPTIVLGGMFGESKYDVLQLVPSQYVPKMLFAEASITKDRVVELIRENNLAFPLIFKPDLGERGFMVKKISSEQEIEIYIKKLKQNFIIQEFLDLPMEFGVFYTRMPEENTGEVTSVVIKDMLTVTGDGISTLEELILDKPRAKLQWDKLKISHADKFNIVLQKGTQFTLNSIGNHCLGTVFLDGNYLINEKLSQTFDVISKQINGFYFGRFDLRCSTVDDLYKGNFKIMELNGCGSEPGHIYQPGFPLRKAIGILAVHLKNMFLISMQNHKRGVEFTTFREGRAIYKKFKEATRP